MHSRALVLAVLLALAGAGAAAYYLRGAPAAGAPAAAPTSSSTANPHTGAPEVVLRAPAGAEVPGEPRGEAPAPQAPPPPEPQGLEDGGSAPLSDFTWKHGHFERERFARARAQIAERIRAGSATPQDLSELHWLDERIHQANEEEGSEEP